LSSEYIAALDFELLDFIVVNFRGCNKGGYVDSGNVENFGDLVEKGNPGIIGDVSVFPIFEDQEPLTAARVIDCLDISVVILYVKEVFRPDCPKRSPVQLQKRNQKSVVVILGLDSLRLLNYSIDIGFLYVIGRPIQILNQRVRNRTTPLYNIRWELINISLW
jgi:hypothetical protein